MHEKGGMELALEMDWKYSTRQMNKVLEMLDVYDSLKEQHQAQVEANKPKK